MQRAQLPETETLKKGRQLIRAVQPEDIANEDNAPEKKPKRRSSGFWNYAVAAVITLYWIGGLAAYFFGRYGLEFLMAQSYERLALLFLALILPTVFVWIVALITRRAQELRAEAVRLGEIAAHLTQPEDRAARGVMRVGHAVRRQIEGMESNLENVYDRLSALEKDIDEKSRALEETSKAVEDRLQDVRSSLGKERDDLAELGLLLTQEGRNLKTALGEKTSTLEDTSETARARIKESSDLLQIRIDALTKASSDAKSNSREASDTLTVQTADLKQASNDAVIQANAITERYTKQNLTMSEAVEKLGEENARIDAKFDEQRTQMNLMAGQLKDRLENIEAMVTKSTSALENAVTHAVSHVDSVGSAFANNAETVRLSGEQAKTALEDAAETALLAAHEADQAMEESTAKIKLTAEDAGTSVREATRKAVDDAQASLAGHAAHIREAMEKTNQALAQSTLALTQKSQSAFEGATQKLKLTADETTKAIEETGQTLEESSLTFAQRAQTALGNTSAKLKLTAQESAKEIANAAIQTSAEAETQINEKTAKIKETLESARNAIALTTQDTTKDAQKAINMNAAVIQEVLEETRNAIAITTKSTAEDAQKVISDNAATIKLTMDETNTALTKSTDEATQRVRAVLTHNADQIKKDIVGTSTALSEAMNKLTAENIKLKSAFDAQGAFLNKVPELVSQQTAKIQKLVAESTDDLGQKMGDTEEKANAVGAAIRAQASAMRISGEDVAKSLKTSLDAATLSAEETRRSLSARAAAIVKQIESSSGSADAALEQAHQALEKRASAVRLQVAQSGTAAEEAAHHAQAKLEAQLGDIRKQISQSSTIVDDAALRLTSTMERIGTVTGDTSQQLDGTLEALETRLDQFPETARTSAERIRDIIAVQMKSLTEIAEEASDRVLNIDEAFQIRLKGIYDTLGGLLPTAAAPQMAPPAPAPQPPAAAAPPTSQNEAVLRPWAARPADNAVEGEAITPPPASSASSARLSAETMGSAASNDSADPASLDGEDSIANLETKSQDMSDTSENIAPTANTDEQAMGDPADSLPQDEASLPSEGLASRLSRRLRKNKTAPSASATASETVESYIQFQKNQTQGDTIQDTEQSKEDVKIDTSNESAKTNGKGTKTIVEKAALSARQDTKNKSRRAQDVKWRDILSAADADEDEDAGALDLKSSNDTNVSRTSAHMIETLQAITVDLARALEENPPIDLVQHYLDGERNVFAHRLARMNKRALKKKIQAKYKKDNEFRDNANRYLKQFEELIATAEKNKVDVYLKADTGSVYTILDDGTKSER